MARCLHIVNRTGVFYWRRRLPAGLAQAFGRPQIRLSLKTRDPKAARRLGGILSVHFDQFLYQMQLEQRVPSADEQRQILGQLHQLILDECKDEHLRGRPLDEIPPEQQIPIIPGDFSDPVPQEARDRQAFFRQPKLSAEKMRGYRMENRFGPIRHLLGPILANRNIDVETDLLAFRKFLDLAIQFAVHAFDAAEAERNSSAGPIDLEELMAKLPPSTAVVEPANHTPQQPESQRGVSVPTGARVSATGGSPPISSFIEGFLKADKEHVSGGTAGQKLAAFKLLVRIVGDIPADAITRKDVERLHDTLQRMPSTYGKSPKDERTPISDIIAGAEIGNGTMKLSTLIRHWRNIKAFYRYVDHQDGVSRMDLGRLFDDLRWSPKVPKGDDRLAWSDECIERLLKSPIWTGFKLHPGKRYWRHEPGHLVIKDEYWWLPLLGLYHGARLEELCQLKGTDVTEDAESGVTVMNFHTGMRLKKPASRRRVPVHSAIIKLGFLEFAAKAGSDLIFPRMKPGGRDNKLGYDYTQDFSEYRKKIGVYEKLKDFHSFRHNVTTKMRDEGGRDFLEIDQITGHDSKVRRADEAEDQNPRGSASVGYFRGHRLVRLKEAIETVNYPAVDLDAIMAAAAQAEMQEADLARRYPKVWGANPEKIRRGKVKVSPSKSAENR
jgi:integrase